MKALCIFLLFSGIAQATPTYKDAGAHHEPHVDWGYAGDHGKGKYPESWGEIAPLCSQGKRQSPINIPLRALEAGKSKAAPALKLNYAEDNFVVFHNRHTVQATAQGKANFVTFAGKQYFLKQFHYHKKSEHLFDGEQFMVEVHFVHEAAPNDLLVIGVLADPTGTGETFSKGLHQILEKYPGKTDVYQPANLRLNPTALFPTERSFVSYPGSLTTPPCLETVTWVVMKSVMRLLEVDEAFVHQKKFDVGFKNFRPHFEPGKRLLTLGSAD